MLDHFIDRVEAGRMLATALSTYAGKPDLIVLALPRGGVPVACEVAKVLQAPLDLWLVRKLGSPGHQGLGVSAVAPQNIAIMSGDTVRAFRVSKKEIDGIKAKEKKELERYNAVYRRGRAAPDVTGKTAIVVDDGLATSSTMRAAIDSLRKAGAARVVAAAPVGVRATCEELHEHADDVVCVFMPEPFYGVSMWYDTFPQLSDYDIINILGSWETQALRDSPQAPPIDALNEKIVPLDGEKSYQTIIDAAAKKKFVLIGEATHGTADFYRIRADITRRLIAEKGFDAVAIEGDWPDTYRVNHYVQHHSEDEDADAALSGFKRFPTWLWRNQEMKEFVEWLHDANARQKDAVGLYGLDLYSMHTSIEAILKYLQEIDPLAAESARRRYACFGNFAADPQAYGYAIATGMWDNCEQKVVEQLIDLQRRSRLYVKKGDAILDEEYFSAWQNARLVKNAEHYYRALFRSRKNSWNLRDQHMFETLEKLADYYSRLRGRDARIIVWAHNSHVGNAAATDMAMREEVNLGQLVSRKYGGDALRIGFSTSQGTVTAASEWDGPAETKILRPPLEGSYEELFSKLKSPRFLLDLRDVSEQLAQKRLQRFIGVIYNAEMERLSHYFHATLPQQFDFIIHLERTEALAPLFSWYMSQAGGIMDETFPSGL